MFIFKKQCSQKKVEDDFICPIVLELPINPVTAEDGRVYEKEAIQQHFEANKKIKSPMTNKNMGKRLLPAPQHKNAIETLIEVGAIAGEAATKWLAKVEDKKQADALLKEAEKGEDSDLMIKVGRRYRSGADGFEKDDKLAHKWFERAHAAGRVIGTAVIGNNLLWGVGVTKDQSTGIMYLGLAAGKGSDYANFCLGLALIDGRGVTKNIAEGRRCLETCLDGEICTVRHITSHCFEMAKAKLEELKLCEA